MAQLISTTPNPTVMTMSINSRSEAGTAGHPARGLRIRKLARIPNHYLMWYVAPIKAPEVTKLMTDEFPGR